MKRLTQDDFNDVPTWVNSLTVNANGELWGHEVRVRYLDCNDRRFWCALMDRVSILIDTGYDVIRWRESAIDRANK